jgi:hypothetical protein
MEEARRRALIAAAVGLLGAALGIVGAGHAYLREWRRAIAWFALVIGVGIVLMSIYTDPSSYGDPWTVTAADLPLEVVLPILTLSLLSVLDAYAVARKQATGSARGGAVAEVEGQQGGAAGGPLGDDQETCPHCGQEVDPELDFCHWCTEPLEREPDA